jgi:hypothetical protein
MMLTFDIPSRNFLCETINSTLATCSTFSPIHSEGLFAARLFYGISDHSFLTLHFLGHVPYTIIILSAAVVRGGDNVDIKTTSIVHQKELVCKFGSMSVVATLINATRVQCVAPNFIGNVSLSISNYPGTWSNEVSVQGRMQPSVSLVFPVAMSSVGSIILTLIGQEFSDNSITCSLGFHSTVANILNNTFATCYFSILVPIEVDIMAFSCHLHRLSIFGPSNITVFKSRQVLKLVPDFFIRGKHNSVVLIVKPNLSPGSDECMCSFGASLVFESVQFDNSSNVICPFPKAATFSVNLLVQLK